MRALSLWRPWPWAFIHGGKRIENRSWEITYRGDVVWQAAKKFDPGSIETIQRAARAIDKPWGECSGLAANHPAGVLSFIGEIVDCVEYDEAYSNVDKCRYSKYGHAADSLTGTLAETHHHLARSVGIDPNSYIDSEILDWSAQAGYIFGPWCAVVVNIRPITETIPWKGAQRWFDVPEEVVAKWL